MMTCYSRKVPPLFWRGAMAILLLLVVLVANRPISAQTNSRTVLAFYYAWFDPSSFGAGKTPFQPPHPYYSTDQATMRRHIATARAAGIDGFIQSWYGPNPHQQTEPNLAAMLNLAQESHFTMAVHFEVASPFFGGNQDRIDALKTLIHTHGRHPAYLKVGGKPVIFFWANWALPVSDWRFIREQADPWGNAIWIAEGGQAQYLSVFDGMHLYNVAWSATPGGVNANIAARTREASETYGKYKYWAATAMPGFDNSLVRGVEHTVRGRGNGAYLRDSFRGAAATNPDFLLLTSFNEWPEGSGIEPSREYGNQYVTLTGQLAAEYKGFDPSRLPPIPAWIAPAPTATPPPPPTAVPPTPVPPTPTPAPVVEERLQTAGQAGTGTGNGPLPTPTQAPVVVVPTATAPQQVAQVNLKASPTPLPNGDIVYEVQAGDTLTAISARYNVSVDRLRELNNLAADALLAVGQRLWLYRASADSAPAPAPPPTATPTPDLPPAPSVPPLPTPDADGRVRYEAQPGDSFIAIADRFGVSVTDLYVLNNLSADSTLRVGQVLVVRIVPTPAPTAAAAQGDPTLPPEPDRQATEEALPACVAGTVVRDADGACLHQVQAGETLIAIALRHGYQTMDAFYEVSGLSGSSLLQIGQEVVVGYRPKPAEQGGSTDAPTAPATPLPVPSAIPTMPPRATPVPANTLPPPPATATPAAEPEPAAQSAETPPAPPPDSADPPANGNAGMLAIGAGLAVLAATGGGWLFYRKTLTR